MLKLSYNTDTFKAHVPAVINRKQAAHFIKPMCDL